jgi:hypothetical protein
MKNNGTTHWRGHHEPDLELGKKREPEVAVTLLDTSCGGKVAAVVSPRDFTMPLVFEKSLRESR